MEIEEERTFLVNEAKLSENRKFEKASESLEKSEDNSKQQERVCHHCKKKKKEGIVKCTNISEKVGCDTYFCESCLISQYRDIFRSENWKCPLCRRICKCLACKRAKPSAKPTEVIEVPDSPKKRNSAPASPKKSNKKPKLSEDLEPTDDPSIQLIKPVVNLPNGESDYAGFVKDNETYRIGDCAVLTSKQSEPYICKIVRVWSNTRGRVLLDGQWFFRREDTVLGVRATSDPKEIFYSKEVDDNELEVVVGKATVKHRSQITDLNEYRKKENHYYFSKLYYSSAFFDIADEASVLKTSQLSNPYVQYHKSRLLWGDEEKALDKIISEDRECFVPDFDENTEPTFLIPCSNWTKQTGHQKFEVVVDSNIFLMIDFHAHLFSTEIIGFLGGTWDPKRMRIHVKEAFPCKSIAEGNDNMNVEMDPISELEIKSKIVEKGMTIVGWYHSHPEFIPDPSVRDIQNQANFQQMFFDESSQLHPFIGAIVATYDTKLPTTQSVYNFFVVEKHPRYPLGIPMTIYYKVEEEDTIPKQLVTEMKKLLYETFGSSKAFLQKTWKKVDSVSMNKLQKFKESLMSKCPKTMSKLQASSFVEDLFSNCV